MTKAERAAEMSRVRKLGVTRAKTKARALRQNAELSEPGGSVASEVGNRVAARIRSKQRQTTSNLPEFLSFG